MPAHGILRAVPPVHGLLGLPAFDIDVALLGFDGAVGLPVLRKRRIPPLPAPRRSSRATPVAVCNSSIRSDTATGSL